MPMDQLDLETIATLAPGVVGLPGGESFGLVFSVPGRRPAPIRSRLTASPSAAPRRAAAG